MTGRYQTRVMMFCVYAALLIISGCSSQTPLSVRSAPAVTENPLDIIVENQSGYNIRVTYPVHGGFMKKGERFTYSFQDPGTYKVVVNAYNGNPHYVEIYRPLDSRELAFTLNGVDTVVAGDKRVGLYLVITDKNFVVVPKKGG